MPATDPDPAPVTNNPRQNLLVFITAVALLLILLAVVLWKDKFSPQAFWIIRIIGMLAAAGFGALIPGFFQLEGVGWKAGGALALGAMAYFFNPPQLPGENEYVIQGTVLIDGVPQSNVLVNVIEKELQKNTNTFGKFAFTVTGEEPPALLSFEIKYHQPDSALRNIDSTIQVPKEQFTSPDFRITLKSDSVPLSSKVLEGHVWNKNGKPLSNVSVTALGVVSTSDAGGFFSLKITTREKKIPVNFSKAGYESKTLIFSVPSSNVSISLN